jgi:hypothetical protein
VQNTTSTSIANTSNIIKFPVSNRNFVDTTSLEEMKEQATQNKIDFVSFISDEMMDELFFKLNMVGFNFDSEDYLKDIVLVSEALKSLMLKSMGIEHAMQLAAEKLVEINS